MLPVAAVLGALFALGSLGALIVFTTVGLLGFVESTQADLLETLWVEIAAVVVLTALTVAAARRRR